MGIETEDANLINDIKVLIFDVCNVQDMEPENLNVDDPLIGPDSVLGLDSLDSLEIAMAVQKKFNVRIDNSNNARRVLKTIESIVGFIRKGSLD
jgi:acyl carrier protein